MKYYLSATDLRFMSDLRTEVIDSIKSKNLPQAIKNDLQLSFNNWLDAQTESLYRKGSELPGEATTTTAPTENGSSF